MPSPGLNGSYLDKMRDAVGYSERNRAAADVRFDEVVAVVTQRIRAAERSGATQSVMSNAAVTATAETQLKTDKRFNSRVDDEQWGARLGTLYAVAELAESVPLLVNLLSQQVTEQRETNQLLRQLLRAQPTTNT